MHLIVVSLGESKGLEQATGSTAVTSCSTEQCAWTRTPGHIGTSTDALFIRLSCWNSSACPPERLDGLVFRTRLLLKIRLTLPGGLEPPTFRLTAERANQLRHGGCVIIYSPQNESAAECLFPSLHNPAPSFQQPPPWSSG